MSGRGCPLPVPDGRRFESLRRYYFGRGRYRLTAARIRWTAAIAPTGPSLADFSGQNPVAPECSPDPQIASTEVASNPGRVWGGRNLDGRVSVDILSSRRQLKTSRQLLPVAGRRVDTSELPLTSGASPHILTEWFGSSSPSVRHFPVHPGRIGGPYDAQSLSEVGHPRDSRHSRSN